jgi:hypothetical protein
VKVVPLELQVVVTVDVTTVVVVVLFPELGADEVESFEEEDTGLVGVEDTCLVVFIEETDREGEERDLEEKDRDPVTELEVVEEEEDTGLVEELEVVGEERDLEKDEEEEDTDLVEELEAVEEVRTELLELVEVLWAVEDVVEDVGWQSGRVKVVPLDS